MQDQIEESPRQIRRDQVEAEVPLEFGRIEIVRKFFDGPIDVLGTSRMHHLELTLLPSSSARFCFPDRNRPLPEPASCPNNSDGKPTAPP